MTDKPLSGAAEYVLTSFVTGASTRKKIYGGFVAVGLGITGFIAYCGATGYDLPSYIVGANAVYNLLSASGFVLAIGNTPSAAPQVPVEQTVDNVGDADEPVHGTY